MNSELPQELPPALNEGIPDTLTLDQKRTIEFQQSLRYSPDDSSHPLFKAANLAREAYKICGKGAVIIAPNGQYNYLVNEQVERHFKDTPNWSKVWELLTTYDPEKYFIVHTWTSQGFDWREIELPSL